MSELLEPGKWLVRYAPPPEDIYWENIVDSHGTYIAKAIIINFFMFFLLVSLFNCLILFKLWHRYKIFTSTLI